MSEVVGGGNLKIQLFENIPNEAELLIENQGDLYQGKCLYLKIQLFENIIPNEAELLMENQGGLYQGKYFSWNVTNVGNDPSQ